MYTTTTADSVLSTRKGRESIDCVLWTRDAIDVALARFTGLRQLFFMDGHVGQRQVGLALCTCPVLDRDGCVVVTAVKSSCERQESDGALKNARSCCEC